ncbi:hypothetical protein MSG28_003473 [Choristoneura fumiferana]|uniref:Uncharacterized protein n=2 Tax=Choristoneura fumiferana TaxID=7141 RepID=A0ACC0KF00_CHOFU|nr:hypothetical protein MSG28_003473 [Choristoneura fumiferana]
MGSRQLFLSRRVVTEAGVSDGAVLVDEDGIIEELLTREEANQLIANSDGKIKPGRTAWEGFRTATNAAAAGGITTIVDMPLNSIPPTTTVENLKAKADSAKGNVYVDVGFWGGVDSLKALVKAGVIGFKCFLCPSGVDEFPNVDAEDLEKAFAALEGTESLLASRPPTMELNAISLITSLLINTNVVPLLDKAREARRAAGHAAWRAGVTAETCHHYLTFSADQIPRGQSEYKCAPPIRDLDNKEKLWEYLLEDKLDLVVSDHSPCTPDLKTSNNMEAWGGISSVQFAASARKLELPSISKYLSAGPARLCGLQNRKGALRTGLDADLVFFDPEATFTLIGLISCREIGLTPRVQERQLFLSRRVVTEEGEFDGGVLVNETGFIEGVLTRASVNLLLSQGGGKFKIIDGGDKALMAGVVDSHVHVNEPGRTSWEGFVTATQAAAAGGVTTIIDMPLNSIPPTTTLKNLKVKSAMAKEEIYVDVGFWGGVIPGNEIELHDLIRAGVVGFKCFLSDSGVSEFPNITPEELDSVFSVLNGTGTVLAFHAELQLNEAPKCEDSNVHVHVVHVSSAGVVPILEEARAQRVATGYRGWRGGVTAETCHHYLTLSSEMVPPGHTEFKCAPPIRNNTNKQKLWEYIRDGRLDLVASDHSPSVADLKGSDFMKSWGGIASLQFDLSLFWTEASARGFGLPTVTHYLSAGPARLCGLQQRKGALKPGLDADLIFFDPNAAFLVTPDIIRYKNKISPYMNRVLRGKVTQTFMPSVVGIADAPNPASNIKMQLECLELAGCTLDRHINADNSRPSFLEITGIAAQRVPTCSGLNAGDYRNLAALLNHPSLSQLKTLNKVPLPPEIMEHFAQISRVWLTIDSNIYVWAFEHGSDVAYFDGLGETIVSVGLVKPKPGVFQSFVKYLLVLTTTVEIVVLAFEEMHLVPEPVFVLPTDGVSMIKINHSTSALSFLVPSFLNAALYDEDPIVKIEVDNSRNILYTLSEKGCIEVFDLGQNGDSLSRVVRLTQGKIVSSATDIVKTLEATNFKPVIAISAVDSSESEHFNLVAGRPIRPQYLALLHVRLPPGFTPNASVLKPKQVHSAVYENGTLLMVCSAGGGEAETLWCLSRAIPGAGFSEAHTLMTLDGPAWALTPLPSQHTAQLSPALLTKKDAWSVSRWAVVTGAGAALVAAGAAPDLLRTLLRDCRGPDAQAVKDFFQLHGVDQACACALYLACEENTSDLSISEWATRAFFLYGGQTTPAPIGQQHMQPANLNQSYQQHQMNQSYQRSPNQPMMPQYQQNAMSPSFNQSFGANVTQQQRDSNYPMQVEFSAKHNGIYIYVGKILAPIWNQKCMSSRVSGEDCAFTVQRLQRVDMFLQRAVPTQPSDENSSLHALKLFVSMAIEMLSLWKVLCEHQFHVIAASLPPEQQSALQAASFRELLVGGQEVACLLLGSLVAGYLRDNASVDGISHKLRQLCPSLYRQEDATCSKANELLIFAKQQKNPAEREEMLQHALKLCKDVAPNVNLPLVCSKLVSAGFYSGVVDLCVACGSKLDPQDKAVHFYKSDQPSQDREGQLIYYRRMEIYREVCNALERLYERSSESYANETGVLNTSRGQAANDNTLSLSAADANYQGRKLVWDCLSRDDELLHVAVYEWLVSKNLGSELLSLGTAPPDSLRTYLHAAARSASPPAALHLLDLLWKVLEKSGDHLAAANVLEGLATRPG